MDRVREVHEVVVRRRGGNRLGGGQGRQALDDRQRRRGGDLLFWVSGVYLEAASQGRFWLEAFSGFFGAS